MNLLERNTIFFTKKVQICSSNQGERLAVCLNSERGHTCKQLIMLLRLHFYYCVYIEKCIDIIINTVVSYL